MPRNWFFDEDKFVAREIDGEYLILDIDKGDYFTLNETGGRIFKSILADHGAQEIRDLLREEFDCSNDTVLMQDIRYFLNDLNKRKVIRVL